MGGGRGSDLEGRGDKCLDLAGSVAVGTKMAQSLSRSHGFWK